MGTKIGVVELHREHFAPQNRYMESRFHLGRQLPLGHVVSFSQSHFYIMKLQPIMSLLHYHAFMFFRVSSRNFLLRGVIYSTPYMTDGAGLCMYMMAILFKPYRETFFQFVRFYAIWLFQEVRPATGARVPVLPISCFPLPLIELLCYDSPMPTSLQK